MSRSELQIESVEGGFVLRDPGTVPEEELFLSNESLRNLGKIVWQILVGSGLSNKLPHSF